MDMSSLTSNFRIVTPYVPGEQPKEGGVIKLNTNENPYPPAPGVAECLKKAEADLLRRYPDPNCTELVSALAGAYGVGEDQVFVGVGSDDVLSLSFLTFFNSGREILFPDVTYSFYDVWADLYRIPWRTVSLGEGFLLQPEGYRRENGGIVIANPNAPTGLYAPLSVIEDILRANRDVVVIVDEAYIDFAGAPSAVSLVDRYPNLLVVQTFSKSRAMAGMRIGFAIGQAGLIKVLSDVKFSFNSYTMSQTALLCGRAAVLDSEYYRGTCGKIVKTREKTKQRLSALGFSFPDSAANFIFAEHSSLPADVIFKELKERRILVRHFNRPGIGNYLRITVGTDEEMDALISALGQIVA